jgi:hypothetical protein
MSDPFINSNSHRELAHRVSGGIEVTLYWNADDNSTSVEVFDVATDARFRFAIAPQRALDAFNHPFVHVRTTFDDAAFARELSA